MKLAVMDFPIALDASMKIHSMEGNFTVSEKL